MKTVKYQKTHKKIYIFFANILKKSKKLQVLYSLFNERHFWLKRKNQSDDFISTYWNDRSENRKNLIKLVATLGEKQKEISILEFGSCVGTNIKLLKDAFAKKSTTFFAVEPNEDAATFLKKKLPFVRILVGEDKAFIQNTSFPGQSIDISFIHAVFYSMAPKRVEKTLEKICKISKVVVIGDEIDNMHGKKASYDYNSNSFLHPYGQILRKYGFKIENTIPNPNPVKAFSGFIVARKD